MLTLPTAKILLFIAVTLGPQGAHTIYATSKSESYVWTNAAPGGWSVTAKSFPASDDSRDPEETMAIGGRPVRHQMPGELRAISSHHWRTNSTMVFDNGDRVEKRGDHAFYIMNAGGANEKVFTICYPKD